MKTSRTASTIPGALLLLAVLATPSLADPYADEFLKFDQQPMLATPIQGQVYFGHDELSTAYLDPAVPNQTYFGTFMADDFADKFNTAVAHVTWWGSYMHASPTEQPSVKAFLISFEKDVPASANAPSHPGDPILSQIVTVAPATPAPAPPPPGNFTESLVRGPDPLLQESVYKYNAELAIPFPQVADTVYWMKIVALVNPATDGQIQWGWHNRDYTIPDPLASTAPAVNPGEHPDGTLPDGTPIWHFQDDAVSGDVRISFPLTASGSLLQQNMTAKNYLPPYDGPTPIIEHSKDLAFQLHTRVPEPSTVVLLGIGLVGLAIRRLRRRAWRLGCAGGLTSSPD